MCRRLHSGILFFGQLGCMETERTFVKTMLRLSENHEEVSVVCDQKGSPTSAKELARAICHFEPTENYGVFHATCEGDTNWAAFAEEIFARAGVQTRVRHVTSEEYARMNPASAASCLLDFGQLHDASDRWLPDGRLAECTG